MSSKAHHKPNIVLILMDDLGYSDVGYLGGDIPTPTLDELASIGIRLNYHYTENVCSATRSALLTGRYAWKTKLDDVIGLPSNQSTDVSFDLISDVLSTNGYNTLFVGKWHIGSAMKAQLPSLRGFQQSLYFSQGMINYTKHDSCISWGTAAIDGIASGDIQTPPESFTIPSLNQRFPKGLCGYDLWWDEHASFISQDTHQYSEDIFVDRIKSYINNYKMEQIKKQPFFIYWSMPTPHTPITVPPETSALCDDLIGEIRRNQCNMMFYADGLIKQVVETLKHNDLYDDTLIMFLSDNGAQPSQPMAGKESAGQPLPFRGAKANTFEGGIRTPAFISGGFYLKHLRERSNSKGCDYNHLVYVADFYPLIAHLSGVNSRFDDIDAINMWSDIETICGLQLHQTHKHKEKKKKPIKRRNEIISFRLSEDNMFYRAVVRTDDYKLLVNPNVMGAPIPQLQFQFDYLENWVNYDAEYYLVPNETYYTLFDEYDRNHNNQRLFYSKCYEDHLSNPTVNAIKTEAHLIGDSGDKVYLFDIKEDNIEACNIAEENEDIVEALMSRLNAQIPLYRGSGGYHGDKGGFAGMRDSYDCDEEMFSYVPWAEHEEYEEITDDWNTLLLSFIDHVDAC